MGKRCWELILYLATNLPIGQMQGLQLIFYTMDPVIIMNSMIRSGKRFMAPVFLHACILSGFYLYKDNLNTILLR